MHRRISARIGQYIDTRFGEKKEKPIAKQEKPEGIVASSDVAPEKEHKSAAAPPEVCHVDFSRCQTTMADHVCCYDC